MLGKQLNIILKRDIKPLVADFKWKYLKDGPACGINSWQEFQRQVRQRDRKLLLRLDDFPNAILVAGCQRSGTTIVTQILSQNEGITSFPVWRDAELDGALILAGLEPYDAQGRCCFQTTYLNEAYQEYFEHKGEFSMVWVLRRPVSTVYSMLYRWRRFALNELFESCGASQLRGSRQHLYAFLGSWSVNRIQRACLAYNGKLSQLFELQKRLGPGRCFVIEYEQLIRKPESAISLLHESLQLTSQPKHAEIIHAGSLDHASGFSEPHRARIEKSCLSIYQQAKVLCVENL